MLNIPEISIVTTTWNRHKQLIQCIEAVKRQQCEINYEHIIVSDGVDHEVEVICSDYKIKHRCIEKDLDQKCSNGHLAKDVGISMASGSYVCLWDDDNFYYSNALNNLYEVAKDHDIGVCTAIYYKKHRDHEYPNVFFEFPKKWTGEFVLGDIDTMNVCVSANLARKSKWHDTKLYEGDYIWLSELCKYEISINFNPTCIGIKL